MNNHTVFFHPDAGSVEGSSLTRRSLADLGQGVFADTHAYNQTLEQHGDLLLYTVAGVEPAGGDGDLHYGLGTLYPGRVGREYFMTKGHLHTWRQAAEVYIGLRGQGAMLLEDERTGDSVLTPLLPNSIVYVPGYTAHRTVNTGDQPLVYMGIYPARAGHDYAAIAHRNFRMVVVSGPDDQPVMMERAEFLRESGLLPIP